MAACFMIASIKRFGCLCVSLQIRAYNGDRSIDEFEKSGHTFICLINYIFRYNSFTFCR